MSNEVDDYLVTIGKPWQAAVCRSLRPAIQTAVPAIEELWNWRKPRYKLDGEYLCDFAASTSWVNVRILTPELRAPSDRRPPATGGTALSLKIIEGDDVGYSEIDVLLRRAAASVRSSSKQ